MKNSPMHVRQLELFDQNASPGALRQIKALEAIEQHPSSVVCGIDEVGMGAWAGPVTVAAVVLPKGWANALVRDSKKTTPSQRKKAAEAVNKAALYSVILSMDHNVVDRIGIQGTRRALTESVGCMARLRFPHALIVQDGLPETAVPIDGAMTGIICLPSADALVPAVGAASIIAKLYRDQHMEKMGAEFPGYDFQNNAGYHSLVHKKMLEKTGPCPIHRRSFAPVKKVLVG